MPSPARAFSFFFAVQRAIADTPSKAVNLAVDYATVQVGTKVTFPKPMKRKASEITYSEATDNDHEAGVGVPIMYNPHAIKKGTKLIVKSDVEVSRLIDKENKEKEASGGKER